jgi:hypothetical protein
VTEVHDVETYAFGGDCIRRDGTIVPVAVDERLDAVGIPEGYDTLIRDIPDDRIAASDLFIHAPDSTENVFRPQAFDVLLCKLLGKNIEDGLHIVFGVEPTFVLCIKNFFDLLIIDDIPVVSHYDSERRVDEEWLGFVVAVTAYRGIAGVADPDVSLQTLEVIFCKDVPYEAVSLFGVETSVISDDSRGILSPVLNGQQSLIEIIERSVVPVDSDYAAHGLSRASSAFNTKSIFTPFEPSIASFFGRVSIPDPETLSLYLFLSVN